MLDRGLVAVTTADRWLLAFSAAALLVLTGAAAARRLARRARASGGRKDSPRAVRRRAGGLVVLGPIIGLLVADGASTETVVVVVGATALAVFGVAIERCGGVDRLVVAAALIAAAGAAVAGVRFGPTGVHALDVAGTVALVAVVTLAFDGFGNADGLVCGIAAAAAGALFALAAFGHQDAIAAVMAGLVGAVVGFLAFNIRPASLFVGRGGRLAIGYVIATGSLMVAPAPGAWRSLTVPLILLGVPLLDAVIVIGDRLGRRRTLSERRADHLVHRLRALGWSSTEAVAALVVAQALLGVVALFVGRAVLPVWAGVGLAAVVIGVLAVEAGRAQLEREPPQGFSRRIRIGLAVLVAAVVATLLPIALVANDVRDLMEQGRTAASRALAAARDGDAITAQGAFREAALTFDAASEKLGSPFTSGGVAVPFLASNVRAARELSEIGTDLAKAGENVTGAVHPEALEVIEGRLPLDEVRRVTPALASGSAALDRALAKLRDVEAEPYLVSPVRDAITKVDRELSRAAGEADRAAAAARLAPAMFGGHGRRTYLVVVQNNAESRATGGFIGSFGLLTADDGTLHISQFLRTAVWNNAVRANPDPKAVAPADYRARYAQFQPERTLQNVNLSPDFPSVAQVLASLAPQAGLPPVDGVLAVDPAGLAALLQLTGPVSVAGWPTEISASNVVNVTLRDAYAAFEETPERADFLGDVAQAVVDEATSGTLGKPANIAKVLGGSAHAGHLTLWFKRPAEQRLAKRLGVAGEVDPVDSDAFAVTTSNAGANKIDYYLQRRVDYRIKLDPRGPNGMAKASADLTVRLDNTAPASGLPQIVIGPFLEDRFVAGENRAYVSLYSPLTIQSATVDGQPMEVGPGVERGRNVYSIFTSIFAKSTRAISARLEGTVRLHHGWYEVTIGHQATLQPDRVAVSIEVPEGWRIASSPKMQRPTSRQAATAFLEEKPATLRVRVVPDNAPLDLWDRLEAGS